MTMKFFLKEINEAKYNQPRTPLRLKSNAAPRLFSLKVFYRCFNTSTWRILADVIGCWAHELLMSFWSSIQQFSLNARQRNGNQSLKPCFVLFFCFFHFSYSLYSSLILIKYPELIISEDRVTKKSKIR